MTERNCLNCAHSAAFNDGREFPGKPSIYRCLAHKIPYGSHNTNREINNAQRYAEKCDGFVETKAPIIISNLVEYFENWLEKLDAEALDRLALHPNLSETITRSDLRETIDAVHRARLPEIENLKAEAKRLADTTRVETDEAIQALVSTGQWGLWA